MGGTGVVIGGTAADAGNVIANGGRGIIVQNAGTSITILGNSLYNNTQLGIDLANDGVTANDGDDSDSGPNLLQNYPMLTALELGSLRLTGSLRSAANTRFDIDVYASSGADPSGHGEGGKYTWGDKAPG